MCDVIFGLHLLLPSISTTFIFILRYREHFFQNRTSLKIALHIEIVLRFKLMKINPVLVQ